MSFISRQASYLHVAAKNNRATKADTEVHVHLLFELPSECFAASLWNNVVPLKLCTISAAAPLPQIPKKAAFPSLVQSDISLENQMWVPETAGLEKRNRQRPRWCSKMLSLWVMQHGQPHTTRPLFVAYKWTITTASASQMYWTRYTR
jgi:hypothetical protein